MARLLTRELLGGFGVGDQFHLLFPESARIVAEITQIRLEHHGDDRRLIIMFRDAIRLFRGTVEPESDLGLYNGPLLRDLSVLEQEDGFMEVLNTAANHVLMFMKPSFKSFVHRDGVVPN